MQTTGTRNERGIVASLAAACERGADAPDYPAEAATSYNIARQLT
jgi:hypothetical protein